jgi:hypothetical protein
MGRTKSKGELKRTQTQIGMADRDGKKGPPQPAWGHVEIVPSSSCDFRLVADGRENIPTIRARFADDGWRRGFRRD